MWPKKPAAYEYLIQLGATIKESLVFILESNILLFSLKKFYKIFYRENPPLILVQLYAVEIITERMNNLFIVGTSYHGLQIPEIFVSQMYSFIRVPDCLSERKRWGGLCQS